MIKEDEELDIFGADEENSEPSKKESEKVFKSQNTSLPEIESLSEDKIEALSKNIVLKKRSPLMEFINFELIKVATKSNRFKTGKRNRSGLSMFIYQIAICFIVGIMLAINLFVGVEEESQFLAYASSNFISCTLYLTILVTTFTVIIFARNKENELVQSLPIDGKTKFLAKLLITLGLNLAGCVATLVPYIFALAINKYIDPLPFILPIILNFVLYSLINAFLSIAIYYSFAKMFKYGGFVGIVIYYILILAFPIYSIIYQSTTTPWKMDSLFYLSGIEQYYLTFVFLGVLAISAIFLLLVMKFIFLTDYNEIQFNRKLKALSKDKLLKKVKKESQTSSLFRLERKSFKGDIILSFLAAQLIIFITGFATFIGILFVPVDERIVISTAFKPFIELLSIAVGLLIGVMVPLNLAQCAISRESPNLTILRTLSISTNKILRVKMLIPSVMAAIGGIFYSMFFGVIFSLDIGIIIMDAIIYVLVGSSVISITVILDAMKPRTNVNNPYSLYQPNLRFFFGLLYLLCNVIILGLIYTISFGITNGLESSGQEAGYVSYIIDAVVIALYVSIITTFLTSGVKLGAKALNKVDF